MKHNYWLARSQGSSKTLLFVVTVEIEKNEDDDGYISTILPLEPGTVIAAGSKPEEAEQAALEMFQEMVDHCLEVGTLAQLIGEAKIMQEIDISIAKVRKAIDEIDARVNRPAKISAPSQRTFDWLVGSDIASAGVAA